MKILVCIKQVPDLESRFKIAASGTWYAAEDLAWRLNEYDEYAVEEAVRLREASGEGELVVLSLGPERAGEAIRKALAMGADRGVHLLDPLSHDKDPRQIAGAIAEYARGEKFDVIFTGLQSQDRGSAQVGLLLAGLLALPAVTTIVAFSHEAGLVTVRRELEGGARAVVKVRLPALFTCQLGLNTPRYPTLPNIMKAKKKEVRTIAVTDLPQVAALVRTEKLAFPDKRGAGVVLEGATSEVADRLIAILKEKTTVLK
ncbi:MAG: electron transfer flavoprotein subunit beta [Desulfuromonadales bacterium GWD2_61_12]|nr:MAG: electron transfer flavoprotein subunit beta [Desulfuromonadales bacterium GWC2_61_20]OGR32010.1 MAG: electron transfer flavoprotein subunit beta [Desulfuromonadales bacterium GWD2_61_12]HBT84045.1 electron transfer flavoprotein subunit beta [Desulfuromonas sp.]